MRYHTKPRLGERLKQIYLSEQPIELVFDHLITLTDILFELLGYLPSMDLRRLRLQITIIRHGCF